jgi:plastocyanin
LSAARLAALSRTLLALAAALLATASLAPQAFGADKQVTAVDIAFTPARVGILPGETVTWSYPSGGNAHNVHFEDGLYTFPAEAAPIGWTGSRTFATEGAYRYYCARHGGPGGAGMSGIVFVNATGSVPNQQPRAGLVVYPTTVAVGADVTLSGASSIDFDGQIAKFEWDLDGDGSYEYDSGAVSQIKRSYATPGPRTVRMRVTDDHGDTAGQTRDIIVTQPPTAGFSVSPTPATTGQAVSFDSTSGDPDGSITEHQWDLNGDGSYETSTGATPKASRTYPAAGSVTVGLRVYDDLGLAATTTRVLQVEDPLALPPAPPAPPLPPFGAPPPPAVAPLPCATLSGANRAACLQKTCRPLFGSKRAACMQSSCRYLANARRASCIQSSCAYLPKSRRASCRRSSCRYLKGAKRKACNRKYSRSRTAGRT